MQVIVPIVLVLASQSHSTVSLGELNGGGRPGALPLVHVTESLLEGRFFTEPQLAVPIVSALAMQSHPASFLSELDGGGMSFSLALVHVSEVLLLGRSSSKPSSPSKAMPAS